MFLQPCYCKITLTDGDLGEIRILSDSLPGANLHHTDKRLQQSGSAVAALRHHARCLEYEYLLKGRTGAAARQGTEYFKI